MADTTISKFLLGFEYTNVSTCIVLLAREGVKHAVPGQLTRDLDIRMTSFYGATAHLIDSYYVLNDHFQNHETTGKTIAYFCGKFAMGTLMMLSVGDGHPDELLENPAYSIGLVASSMALCGITVKIFQNVMPDWRRFF